MITYYAISDTGGRLQNEDSILCMKKNDVYCFAVADGLGGHKNSSYASEFVTDSLKEMVGRSDVKPGFLTFAINECQKRLLDHKKENDAGNPLTTIVVLVITEDFMQWAHVGDSRLYLFKNNNYIRTYDHSVPQMLVDANKITEKEIRKHPSRNRILRALGDEWDKDRVEISGVVKPEKGDSFLLCSDGFWEYIEEDVMQEKLRSAKDTAAWIRDMESEIRLKGMSGGMDNYSAIGIWNR